MRILVNYFTFLPALLTLICNPPELVFFHATFFPHLPAAAFAARADRSAGVTPDQYFFTAALCSTPSRARSSGDVAAQRLLLES